MLDPPGRDKIKQAQQMFNRERMKKYSEVGVKVQALQEDPELASLLPLIRQFYTTPSTYLWGGEWVGLGGVVVLAAVRERCLGLRRRRRWLW